MTTLPPDPDDRNDDRAAWATTALAAFRVAVETDDDDETVLCDLLADLMHWCDRKEINFLECLTSAEGHYAAETEGETP